MIESVALNMVVYNEENRVYETLRSAAYTTKLDEIVIVDQSSTDSTLDEIQQFNEFWNDEFYELTVSVYTDKHHGYCEPSRKMAAQHTRSDWILVLDADERISEEFAAEMRMLDEWGYKGCEMVRSFYLADHHRFTGDTQYRYFKRGCAKFLNEIHTSPQPTNLDRKREIYHPEYVALIHEKSWAEQLRDELEYERLVPILDGVGEAAKRKMELNVHLALIREKGLTVEQVIAMTKEERLAYGLDLE